MLLQIERERDIAKIRRESEEGGESSLEIGRATEAAAVRELEVFVGERHIGFTVGLVCIEILTIRK